MSLSITACVTMSTFSSLCFSNRGKIKSRALFCTSEKYSPFPSGTKSAGLDAKAAILSGYSSVALAKVRIEGIVLYDDLMVNAAWVLPTLFFGLGALFSSFAIPPLLKMTADRGR